MDGTQPTYGELLEGRPMFSIALGPYTLSCYPDRLPELYGEYVKHAGLVEEFDLDGPGGSTCVLAVSRGVAWPFLVVAQRYGPAGIFHPGALLVAETGVLFIGAGERLLAYSLDG